MWASEKHLKTGLMRVEASEWSVALFQKHGLIAILRGIV